MEELIEVLLPLSRWGAQVLAAGGALFDAPRLRRHRETVLEAGFIPPSQAARDFQWLAVLCVSLWRAREAEVTRAMVSALSRNQAAEAVEAFRGTFRLRPPAHAPVLHLVSLNRVAHLAMWRSTATTKADAARHLFSASGRGINWAVFDSGIDARHPAFRAPPPPTAQSADGQPQPRDPRWQMTTRVRRTFDFSRLRRLLSDPVSFASAEMSNGGAPASAEQRRRWEQLRSMGSDYFDQDGGSLASGIQRGVTVPWERVIPFIEIPHSDDYRPPGHDHGTHVAGILAGRLSEQDVADWPADESAPDEICGMCPEIGLYDFRVFTDSGDSDEFTLVAALQYLRYLNAQHDQLLIHGANLSFSLKLDFATYACGRTPICEECDRTVSSGVVVVAAAGNQGGSLYTDVSPDGQARGSSVGYRAISITDPGNAELVITVGATHASHPHAYGVSFFSSRGPTGDGRRKPDLVAPGEKILGPVPNGGLGRKDGTSMAAPHVSGAAALLMCRHRELIGAPARVKDVLMRTATDLGREPSFQGAGLLDILRAIQSV
ncbi:MAG: protease [Gemmatimonas sp.]|nr:protease [Gemmatimonas sp.]